MNKQILPIFAALLLATSSVFAQRETVFFTAFEYGNDELQGILEPAELNGAEDQVGEWSGDEFPEGQGDIADLGCDLGPPCDSVGFRDNPFDGSRLMILDRPTGDPDRPNSQPNSDFEGSILANFTNPILLVGAEVSFDLGVFRTGGNHNKDFSIVGRDGDGEESFHLRIGTNNNGFQRLGVRQGGDDAVLWDLPTVVGDDGPEDLDNMGAAPNGGFALGDEFPRIKLKLGAEGYTIDLKHDEQNNSAQANAYVTDTIAYNGPAQDLALVDFGYKASGANGRNAGFALDNILVTGFEELLLGDFDANGEINVADFNILAANFATQSSEGDFDFNGVVDLHDFVGFKAAFNAAQAPAAAAVPEPATVSMIFIGLLGLLARRRRRTMKGA